MKPPQASLWSRTGVECIKNQFSPREYQNLQSYWEMETVRDKWRGDGMNEKEQDCDN